MTVVTPTRALDVELQDVTLLFPRPDGPGMLPVYENFDLSVEQGSFTILLGPSGCGKSTLLNIVDGLLAPPSTLGGFVRRRFEEPPSRPQVHVLKKSLRWVYALWRIRRGPWDPLPR